MKISPYRIHEFYSPTNAPHFDNPELRWFSIVGEFIEPIIRDEKDLIYWFCDHGGDFQLCFVSDDFVRIEKKIETQKDLCGVGCKTPAKNNQKIEFIGNDRCIARDKIGTDKDEKRGWLFLQVLHATCALMMDNLVRDGNYWRVEKNDNALQNPEGSSFESLHHLFCNISKVSTPVFEFELKGQKGCETSHEIGRLCHLLGCQPIVHGKILVHF